MGLVILEDLAVHALLVYRRPLVFLCLLDYQVCQEVLVVQLTL